MVAGKAAEIEKLKGQVSIAQNEAREASQVANRLECRLSNLKTEFTRLVSKELDASTVEGLAREIHSRRIPVSG